MDNQVSYSAYHQQRIAMMLATLSPKDRQRALDQIRGYTSCKLAE